MSCMIQRKFIKFMNAKKNIIKNIKFIEDFFFKLFYKDLVRLNYKYSFKNLIFTISRYIKQFFLLKSS